MAEERRLKNCSRLYRKHEPAQESEGLQCQLEGEPQAGFTGILEIRSMVRAWEEDKTRMLLDKRHSHNSNTQPP